MYIRSQLPLWNPLRTACGSWLSTIPLSLADVGFLSDTILSDVSSIYCMKEGGVFFGNCVVSYRCRGVGVSVAWFPTRGDSFWPSCSWFLLFFFFVFFFSCCCWKQFDQFWFVCSVPVLHFHIDTLCALLFQLKSVI